jgi:hypothetical protein
MLLSVVSYEYETLSLILREEHRLTMFNNKVLRKLFEAKRMEKIAFIIRTLHQLLSG